MHHRRGSRPAKHEDGFVLLAAIWLLVLGGSIAAYLSIRALSVSIDARGAADALQRDLALKAAVETVMASRMFEGSRSRWWLTPTQGTLRVGGLNVTVRLTSESGRLDVNETDLETLDAAFQGLGVVSADRARSKGALERLRDAGDVISSIAELEAVLPPRVASRPCLLEFVTIASGRPEPRADQMPDELARALGMAGAYTGKGSEPELGAALRVEVSTSGQRLLVIGRVSGASGQPLAVQAWEAAQGCRASG